MGETADQTGMSMDQLDGYALIASDALYKLSGSQFAGPRTRTIQATVGRTRGRIAKVSLGPWWPINSVADVVGVLPTETVDLTPGDDWTWSGGITLSVPSRFAGQAVRALIDYGQAPPANGKLAAIAFGVELAANDPTYNGSTDTRLPSLMTSRSRQGITETFESIVDAIEKGVTGLQEVDLFRLEYNSGKANNRPHVRIMRP